MRKTYVVTLEVPELVGGEVWLRNAINGEILAKKEGVRLVGLDRDYSKASDPVFEGESDPTIYKDELADKAFFTVVNFESSHWLCNQLGRYEHVKEAIDRAGELARKWGKVYHVLKAVVRVERDFPPVRATELK
jgi:hypothetical protein